jgi:hypothetical protein
VIPSTPPHECRCNECVHPHKAEPLFNLEASLCVTGDEHAVVGC